MAHIHVHPSLVRFTDNQHNIELSVDTVDQLLPTLCQHYPLLKACILNAEGDLTPYVNIYINGKNLADSVPKSPIATQDKVDLVTALVGG